MILPDFPPAAKPHEMAIMLIYAMGIHDAKDIAQFLHYTTIDSVYRVFRDYKNELPKLRERNGTLIGPGLIQSSKPYCF